MQRLRWRWLSPTPRPAERPAWRAFLLGLFGLGASLFLAIYATALRMSGREGWAATAAAVSLLLAGYVAIKVVPPLARRTILKRWFTRVEFEFTTEGLVYLLLVVAIAVAALNSGNNLLFIVLACLLAGAIVSGLMSQIVLSELELDFALPEHIFAGRPVVAHLTLRNSKRVLPSFSVMVIGREQKRKKGRDRQEAAASPADASRQILERPVYITYIPHNSSVIEHVELSFPRRGRYTQDGFKVSTKFPFALLRRLRPIAAGREILVLPSVEPTEEFYEVLPLLSGEIESLARGRGHDLYAIRDHHASDSARHVDWKATAKARQLKVREFTREDERRVVLALDSRLTEANEESLAQFEKAVKFCACLAWHFYEINAQMQFLCDGFETLMETAADVVYPTLEKLALVEPRLDDRAGDLLARLSSLDHAFNIIVTGRTRGSIPTSLWGSSYLVFMDSL